MRTIKRLILLGVLVYGGVVAMNYWSDGDWPDAPRAAALNTDHARERAARVADRVADRVTRVADRAADRVATVADRVADRVADGAGNTLQGGALTAKIKAKMALDDNVNARAIDVDTAGSVVTLRGAVASAAQRQRAVRLASETEGVTRVIDKLEIKQR